MAQRFSNCIGQHSPTELASSSSNEYVHLFIWPAYSWKAVRHEDLSVHDEPRYLTLSLDPTVMAVSEAAANNDSRHYMLSRLPHYVIEFINVEPRSLVSNNIQEERLGDWPTDLTELITSMDGMPSKSRTAICLVRVNAPPERKPPRRFP